MLYIISKNIKCYCIKIKIKCIKSLNVRHNLNNDMREKYSKI